MKLITTILPDVAVPSTQMPGKMAKVYQDPDTNEYIVSFYIDGILQSQADYYTDDMEDAVNTARYFVEGGVA